MRWIRKESLAEASGFITSCSIFSILAVVTSEQAMAAKAGMRRTRGFGDDSDQKPDRREQPCHGKQPQQPEVLPFGPDEPAGPRTPPGRSDRIAVFSRRFGTRRNGSFSSLKSILHLHKPPGATSSFRSCLGARYHHRPEKTIGAYAESISIGPELVRNHLAQWRAIVVCSFEHDIIDVHVAAIGVIAGAKGDLK